MKKIKVYSSTQRKQKVTLTFLLLVGVIYLFFFTSKFTLPAPITDKSNVAPMNEIVEYSDNRTYRIISVNYSPDQNMMEVILQFTNTTYDNINDYYYILNLDDGSAKNAEIKEILNDPLMTVIRIKHLKNFEEINLYIAPKVATLQNIKDNETAKIIFNKYNISEVKKIDINKSKTDYLIDRLQYLIADYNKTLTHQKKQLEEYNTKMLSLENENKALDSNGSFMMSEEITEAEKTKQSNLEQIKATQESISKQQEKIASTNKMITDAGSKIRELRK